ncbi:dienelactone hydrolase family protein [Actinomadura sp. ATCC 31491]|uniref:Dienelactone hydrolase family protein n=1 Tax=Actinomadura luzonensis TaxID=2805427 RepID=A0ABT0G266_9ACTN|nr:dienelactone hydrolase family protein [Actinomadura luzonensis]MCK2218678.1 dienelactone hydrolase family protein [Actinomadura luzonensis]
MARILLLHSMYGLRPAVHQAAERFRAAGHEVHVPDLYDGRVVADAEEAIAIKEEIGRDELLKRAVAAAAPLSVAGGAEEGLVYAGFSLGAAIAQNLALGDERSRGLLLMHGTSDLPDGVSADDLPVQLHVADPDTAEPADWLNAWYIRMRRARADVEVFRYPGAGHLFTDPELPDYDERAAERAWAVALGFVAGL